MRNLFETLPDALHRLLAGSPARPENIGRSGARVLLSEDMCLKIAPRGSLERAAVMQEYFHKKGLSAPLIKYLQTEEQDYLLMGRVRGTHACDRQLMSEPKKLARRIGEVIRMLHETDASDCPLADVNRRNYDALNDPVLDSRCSILRNDVLVHGDCCLPNLFFDGDAFCGFVDLGEAGLGDRHFDLYWAEWSLEYNLGTNEYRDDLLNAYGRDAIDKNRAMLCRLISETAAFG
jgi:kanamycin kinase